MNSPRARVCLSDTHFILRAVFVVYIITKYDSDVIDYFFFSPSLLLLNIIYTSLLFFMPSSAAKCPFPAGYTRIYTIYIWRDVCSLDVIFIYYVRIELLYAELVYNVI